MGDYYNSKIRCIDINNASVFLGRYGAIKIVLLLFFLIFFLICTLGSKDPEG